MTISLPWMLETRIARCVEIKADVVADDEREGGRRAILNYGHTLAHALETATDHSIAHGEAVAIGLVFAAELALATGRIGPERVDEHRRVIATEYDLVVAPPDGLTVGELMELMSRGKKAVVGLTFVLDGPDGVEVVADLAPDVVAATLSLFIGSGRCRHDVADVDPCVHPDRSRLLCAIQARMPQEHNADAVLLTDPVDIRWLTGFTGSSVVGYVIGSDRLVLGTDGRYGDRARPKPAQVGATVIAETVQSEAARSAGRVDSLPHGRRARPGLDESTRNGGALAGTSCCRTDRLAHRTAASHQGRTPRSNGWPLAARARRRARSPRWSRCSSAPVDRPVTEADVRNELEYRMRLHGADDRSYDTIVANGPGPCGPPPPRGRRVARSSQGDTVIIDVGHARRRVPLRHDPVVRDR